MMARLNKEPDNGIIGTPRFPARILVIDDEDILLKSCERALKPAGYDVITTSSPLEALDLLERDHVDLILSDLKMPELDGMELLRRVKEDWPDAEVIIMTGHGTVNTAVSAMKLGVFDYIEKPFTPDAINVIVEKAMERKKLFLENMRLKNEIKSHYIKNIVGNSPSMEKIFRLISAVAPSSSTVLITGESGTGKELIARAIHYNSPRHENPFVVVDCGTISETLMESELFGYRKGAFTGATESRRGLLDAAHTGTLFLDEIGNLPLSLQSKLLRVLQEREYRPVGDKKSFHVDIRIIAATNVDLKQMVKDGTFREDLYYRLNIFPIPVPPLRSRREDIPTLAYHFLSRFSAELDKPVRSLSVKALSALLNHDWPGNVRELENTVHRSILLCGGDTILPEHISFIDSDADRDVPRTVEELKVVKKQLRSRSVEKIERDFIVDALKRNSWNVSRAARDVGMQRTNFHSLIKKYNITVKPESSLHGAS